MLGEHRDAIGGAHLQAILRDHEDYPKSVCRHPDGDPTETQSACSVLLMPADRRMAVAVGTPCSHAPVEYRL
jgi:isopenicillin-N N-acyltransferase-like protein